MNNPISPLVAPLNEQSLMSSLEKSIGIIGPLIALVEDMSDDIT